MGVKWMNCAAATTNFPTDGIGGRSATNTDSGFADAATATNNGGKWDNREAILMELVIVGGAAAACTALLTSHNGVLDVLPTFSAPANGSVTIDLHGIAIRGVRLVTVGAGGAAFLKFDVGGETTYAN